MQTVRANQAVVVRHPEVEGAMVAISNGQLFDVNDPVVRTYPWAFGDDPDATVEEATANPGQKRNVKR